MASLYDRTSATTLTGSTNSPIIRRLRSKYIGRLASSYLPPPAYQVYPSAERISSTSSMQVEDFEVLEEVETLLSELLEALTDSVSTAAQLKDPVML